MKVIVAGSRSIVEYRVVARAIERSGLDIEELVSGHQAGVQVAVGSRRVWLPTVDLLGERWAHEHGIPVRTFPADWQHYGKMAGHLRNVQMADYVSAEGGLVLVWDGTSPGSADMLHVAQARGLHIHRIVHVPDW